MTIQSDVERVYQSESRKVFATLLRLLGDFELAEEATQEAFTAAAQAWPEKGLPKNPGSWLISTGRFKMIDRLRRENRFQELEPELALRWEEIEEDNRLKASYEVHDDRLRLIFTCCHPAIDPKVQVPLTLREVCGLTTGEIARAYLTTHQAMAQRIVRGKNKIRQAGIPYRVPELKDLPERLLAVLRVVYLVFNEGYSASSGETAVRTQLGQEAIRLGRLLHQLLPEPEVKGLLALMLLHESRRETRLDEEGDIVLLADQDRAMWDRGLIEEGDRLLTEALSSGRFGPYTLQAAISAVHAQTARPEETDWAQILALYNLLQQVEPTPVVALNRAVAVSMVRGPEAGLAILDELLADGHLADYALAHSARGKWLLELERRSEAFESYSAALGLAGSASEKRFLEKCLAECREQRISLD